MFIQGHPPSQGREVSRSLGRGQVHHHFRRLMSRHRRTIFRKWLWKPHVMTMSRHRPSFQRRSPPRRSLASWRETQLPFRDAAHGLVERLNASQQNDPRAGVQRQARELGHNRQLQARYGACSPWRGVSSLVWVGGSPARCIPLRLAQSRLAGIRFTEVTMTTSAMIPSMKTQTLEDCLSLSMKLSSLLGRSDPDHISQRLSLRLCFLLTQCLDIRGQRLLEIQQAQSTLTQYLRHHQALDLDLSQHRS